MLRTGGITEIAWEWVLHLKLPKFEHIFVAVITFSPFFCANTFDTSLLLVSEIIEQHGAKFYNSMWARL